MFDGMRDDAALLIELKDKEAGELLAVVLPLASSQPLRDLIHVLARAYALVEPSRAFILRLPDRLPPDN